MAAKKATPKPKPKPGPEPEPEPESEARRLHSLAVTRLRSSAFKSALKYARRARRLSPSLPFIDLMVTALKILRSSPDDHYSVLLLPPLSPLSLITTHYQTLTLTLKSHSSIPGAADAIARLNRSFSFLSDPDRKNRFDDRFRPSGSFWTACATCRLLHEFDRKYLGHRLLCPSCNKTFLAAEVAENESRVRVTGARSKTRPKPRFREKTLAEMQMEILNERANSEKKKKKKKKKKKNGKLIISVKEEEGLSLMAVDDPEFYNFDEDRGEKCFSKGQVWAIFDDDDGMPRNYGLVDDVMSLNPFRVQMRWLDIQADGDEANVGRFKVGRKVYVDSVNMFSHVVGCERAAKEIYRIYPKKGSVWALYAEGGEEERKYDIVVFLTSYSEMYGLSMAYLEKVEGFKTIFKRQEIGCHAVRWLEKDNVRLFSHQIPARKLSGEEDENLPKDCWELDPASLPSEMLRTGQFKRGQEDELSLNA